MNSPQSSLPEKDPSQMSSDELMMDCSRHPERYEPTDFAQRSAYSEFVLRRFDQKGLLEAGPRSVRMEDIDPNRLRNVDVYFTNRYSSTYGGNANVCVLTAEARPNSQSEWKPFESGGVAFDAKDWVKPKGVSDLQTIAYTSPKDAQRQFDLAFQTARFGDGAREVMAALGKQKERLSSGPSKQVKEKIGKLSEGNIGALAFLNELVQRASEFFESEQALIAFLDQLPKFLLTGPKLYLAAKNHEQDVDPLASFVTRYRS